MRRALACAAVLAALAPAAANAAGWHSEQPVPPAGSGVSAPVPLGPIGDIAFWAPNRGLLTTAGNDGVPAGIYAYDGSGWYLLSTVCGGHDGRIAWATPNEWWTIADQTTGQELGQGSESNLWQRSLCHFVDGQVVASYAEPIGTPSSYERMDAAACDGPDDCWFAGERLPGTTNVGAFHLHWDGHALTTLPPLTTPQPELSDPPRAVADVAFHAGHLYESVQVQLDDDAPEESADQPFLLHEIADDSSNPFLPLFTEEPIDYGAGVRPWQLAALDLSSDGTQLWAIAGAAGRGLPAHVTALRLGASGFTQIALQDMNGVLPAGTTVSGVAADPGTDAAWVAFTRPDDPPDAPARLTRIHADGTVEPSVALPGDADGISRKGGAGRVTCPAAGQCWAATTDGWLFHLGESLPRDDDPGFHRVITYRPPDNGVPFLPPDSLPIDDSGANLPPDQTPPPGDDQVVEPRARPRPLAYRIHQQMVHGTTLELSFSLRARAHVRLVAKRHRRVVARTRGATLGHGAHRLRLRLDPRRWPTSLDLQVHAIHTRARR